MTGFFQELQDYVGFGHADQVILRALHPGLAPDFPQVSEVFYARILEYPPARAVLERGESSVGRLRHTLVAWMDGLFQGPWDEAYVEHAGTDRPGARPHRAPAALHVRGDEPAPPRALGPHLPARAARLTGAPRGAERALPDAGPGAGDHAPDLPGGPGGAEGTDRAALDLRTGGGQHRPRAAEPAGRRRVLGVPPGEARGDGPERHGSTCSASASRSPWPTASWARSSTWSGTGPWTREQLSLSEVVESAVDRVPRPEGVKVELGPLNGLNVLGDAAQLRQVFVNLVQNAVDACGESGEVRVEARSRRREGGDRRRGHRARPGRVGEGAALRAAHHHQGQGRRPGAGAGAPHRRAARRHHRSRRAAHTAGRASCSRSRG